MLKIFIALSRHSGLAHIRFEPDNSPEISKVLPLIRTDPEINSLFGSVASNEFVDIFISILASRLETWAREGKINQAEVRRDD